MSLVESDRLKPTIINVVLNQTVKRKGPPDPEELVESRCSMVLINTV